MFVPYNTMNLNEQRTNLSKLGASSRTKTGTTCLVQIKVFAEFAKHVDYTHPDSFAIII